MNYSILLLEEERRKNRQFRLIRRNLRDNFDIFNLPENRFQELFRFTKDCYRYLLETIQPHIQMPSTVAGLSPELKILVALRFFATGSYQRCVGQDFNLAISQSSVSRCIKEIGLIIEKHLMPVWVKFPSTPEEINNKKQEFMRKFNFSGVIGCIDGTQVAILKPIDEPHNCYNRKGYYSKNVQIICHAGSSHDSHIWQMSAVRANLENKFENGERNSWLLGDSGYPQEPWLMTPVLGAAPNTPED